jgi:hypothetical protein
MQVNLSYLHHAERLEKKSAACVQLPFEDNTNTER